MPKFWAQKVITAHAYQPDNKSQHNGNFLLKFWAQKGRAAHVCPPYKKSQHGAHLVLDAGSQLDPQPGLGLKEKMGKPIREMGPAVRRVLTADRGVSVFTADREC